MANSTYTGPDAQGTKIHTQLQSPRCAMAVRFWPSQIRLHRL